MQTIQVKIFSGGLEKSAKIVLILPYLSPAAFVMLSAYIVQLKHHRPGYLVEQVHIDFLFT